MKISNGVNKLISVDNFLYLVIFSLPLYLLHIKFFGLPSNVFEVLAILSIVFFVIKKKKDFVSKFKTLPRLILIAVSLILVGLFLSILSGGAYLTGLGILKSWFLIPILFSYALYVGLDSENSLEKVLASVYFSVVLVGLIGLIYKILGIVTFDNRLEAFYQSPNYLAMYLSPGIFFGYYFLVKSFQNKKSKISFSIHILLWTIILVPLYFTYSYGAWLSVLLALLTITALIMSRKCLLMVFLFAAFASIFIFQTNTQKFSALANFSERSSFASRMMIWNASILMIKQHPFLGIGPGNFQTVYLSLQKFFPPYLEWAVPQPHNLFLAFWLQAGLLGLIGFLLLLFFVFRTLLGVLKNKKEQFLAAPLFGFFLYTVLHGLVDTPYWKNDLSFLFWICVFFTLLLRNYSKKNTFNLS